jgi:hypothetical protein
MSASHSNPCTRCGKERIFVRTWKEKVDFSVITTTENACPDIECQKMVDEGNAKQIARIKFSRLKRRTSLSRNGKSTKKVGNTLSL